MENVESPSQPSVSEKQYKNLREYTDQLHIWLYQYRMWNSMQSISTMFPLMLNHCASPQLSFPHQSTASHNTTTGATPVPNNTRRSAQNNGAQNQRSKKRCTVYISNHFLERSVSSIHCHAITFFSEECF